MHVKHAINHQATSLLSNYCNKCFLSFILKRKRIELADLSNSLNPYPSTCYVNLNKLFYFGEPQISWGDDQHLHCRGFRIEWVKTWNYLKSSIWLCDFVIICYSCNMCSVRVDLITILNDNSKLDYYNIKDNILSTWLMICGATKKKWKLNLKWGKKDCRIQTQTSFFGRVSLPIPQCSMFLISNKLRTNPLS